MCRFIKKGNQFIFIFILKKLFNFVFFVQLNDWFNIFNSKGKTIDSRPRCMAYGLEKEVQDNLLSEIKEVIGNIRVGNNKSRLPFQEGVIMGMNAISMLYEDLKEEYNLKYLLTRRINQDPLEGFFSIIRAIGGLHDHPTTMEFQYRLRNYLLGRNQVIVGQSTNIDHNEKFDIECENNDNRINDGNYIITTRECNIGITGFRKSRSRTDLGII